MKSIRKIAGLLVTVFLLLTAFGALAAPLTGSKVKDFTIRTMDGNTFRLYDLLEEKDMVVFDFWFVDCPSCPNSLKSLQRCAEQYKERIAVFGLNINNQDKDDEIREFAERNQLTIPLARDQAGLTRIVHSTTSPHIVIILKGGILLISDLLSDPGTVIENGLMLTEQDIRDLAEWNKTYRNEKEEPGQITGRFAAEAEMSGDAAKRAWVDHFNNNYASEKVLKMELEGEDVRRIIVDGNLPILQAWQRIGQYYLVKLNRKHTLRLEFGKGVKTKSISTTGLPELSQAEKDGNTYIFRNVRGYNFEKYMIDFGDTNSTAAGYMTFFSEKDAEKYFTVMEKVSGYAFPWHVEETPEE